MTPLAPWARAPPSVNDRLRAIDEFRTAVEEFERYLASALRYLQQIDTRYIDVGRLGAIERSITGRSKDLANTYSKHIFRRAITDKRYLRKIGPLMLGVHRGAHALAFVISKHRQPQGTELRDRLRSVSNLLGQARQRILAERR